MNRNIHDNLRDVSFFEGYRATKMPLNYSNGLEHVSVPKSRALVNAATGKLLSPRAVSDTYTLENHADLYAKHSALIQQTNLPYNNVEVIDEITDNGLKARRSIRYLDTGKLVGGNEIFCRSDVISSIDMSWAFQMFSGAYNSYCENSMVFGGTRAFYNKSKHTKNFNSGALLKTANQLLETYTLQSEKFDRWISQNLTYDMVVDFLKTNIADYPISEVEKLGAAAAGKTLTPQINYKKLGVLLQLWEDYAHSMGRNAWALYNVLTHYSTHTHETYQLEIEDKHGEIKQVDHATGRNIDKAMVSPKLGRKYSLSTQVERSNQIAFVILQPPFSQPLAI